MSNRFDSSGKTGLLNFKKFKNSLYILWAGLVMYIFGDLLLLLFGVPTDLIIIVNYTIIAILIIIGLIVLVQSVKEYIQLKKNSVNEEFINKPLEMNFKLLSLARTGLGSSEFKQKLKAFNHAYKNRKYEKLGQLAENVANSRDLEQRERVEVSREASYFYLISNQLFNSVKTNVPYQKGPDYYNLAALHASLQNIPDKTQQFLEERNSIEYEGKFQNYVDEIITKMKGEDGHNLRCAVNPEHNMADYCNECNLRHCNNCTQLHQIRNEISLV